MQYFFKVINVTFKNIFTIPTAISIVCRHFVCDFIDSKWNCAAKLFMQLYRSVPQILVRGSGVYLKQLIFLLKSIGILRKEKT